MKLGKLAAFCIVVLAWCSVAVASQQLSGGSTDEYVYFIAVDVNDLHTRETDLTNFTVYYSINGGNSTAMTTPTTGEVSKANQPGEYKLLIDEAAMTTLPSGNDQANMILSISHASMDRVTLAVVVKGPMVANAAAAKVAAEANKVWLEHAVYGLVNLWKSLASK